MTEPTLTPARLWKQISSAQRIDTARAFWLDEQASDDQIQAVLLIAQQKKFRTKFVLGLDADRKAKHLASLPGLSDAMVARILVVYHLSRQREMMGAFLDALGIGHEEGLIKDDEVKPDPEKLAPALATLRHKFPAADVALYLSTLYCQDPDTWGLLADVPERQLASAVS